MDSYAQFASVFCQEYGVTQPEAQTRLTEALHFARGDGVHAEQGSLSVAKAKAEEREACAKIVDDVQREVDGSLPDSGEFSPHEASDVVECAARRIRARGTPAPANPEGTFPRGEE